MPWYDLWREDPQGNTLQENGHLPERSLQVSWRGEYGPEDQEREEAVSQEWPETEAT
jgi:hypothetical protein